MKRKEEARESYSLVAGKQHHKFKLCHKGFEICMQKPFIGASVDDLRSCECSCKCGNVVVECKCHWVHRNNDPKDEFVSQQVGRVLHDWKFLLPEEQVKILLHMLRCKCLSLV